MRSTKYLLLLAAVSALVLAAPALARSLSQDNTVQSVDPSNTPVDVAGGGGHRYPIHDKDHEKHDGTDIWIKIRIILKGSSSVEEACYKIWHFVNKWVGTFLYKVKYEVYKPKYKPYRSDPTETLGDETTGDETTPSTEVDTDLYTDADAMEALVDTAQLDDNSTTDNSTDPGLVAPPPDTPPPGEGITTPVTRWYRIEIKVKITYYGKYLQKYLYKIKEYANSCKESEYYKYFEDYCDRKSWSIVDVDLDVITR